VETATAILLREAEGQNATNSLPEISARARRRTSAQV
jgi:hypothetical protein